MFADVHALLLFGRLPPVATPAQAWKRIQLAHLALTRMPREVSSSASRYLVTGTLPARALEAVGRFLDRHEWPHPGELQRQLLLCTNGPSEGARIVLQGVISLVRAVDELHHRTVNLAAVVRRADRAVRCACQANENGDYTDEALGFVARLQDELYGPLPAWAALRGHAPLAIRSPR